MLQIGKFVKRWQVLTFLLVCRNLPGKANLKTMNNKTACLLKQAKMSLISFLRRYFPLISPMTGSNVSQILKIEKGYFLYLIQLQGRIIKCPMSIRPVQVNIKFLQNCEELFSLLNKVCMVRVLFSSLSLEQRVIENNYPHTTFKPKF